MRGRVVWVVAGLLCLMGALWLWRGGVAPLRHASPSPAIASSPTPAASQPKTIFTQPASSATKVSPGNNVSYRLANTRATERELLRNDRAILLANALIDTARPLDALNIPDKLKAPPDNGSWIVQARGPLDAPFRALLAGSGAQVVSYIPNDAELVLASASVAQQLATSPLVASVLPYEPYYKLTDPGLLKLAVEGTDLPPDVGLRLGVFPGMAPVTETALTNMGAEVADAGPSPFGEILCVHPAKGTFLDVAALPGVMVVEAMHQRSPANDLMRPRLGVTVNSVTNEDYLNLSGLGVYVNVNDSDVDTSHPDLAGRILLDPTATGSDPNGHGTHVIGTILGSGVESSTVGTNASGSVTNANFRGMATNAQAYVIAIGMSTRPDAGSGAPSSDAYLQETAGRTNTFISNNSWNYGGDAEYDMAAASYDAAVRDAVPEWTGPQPLLYVFSAGNDGGAASDGTGGISDTILSPGTAKNVITVGAIEAFRNITNKDVVDGATNQPWLTSTDSSNQVASFSSRGPVGVGIEGLAGRFKPDLVAPGTFVLSDKPNSNEWDQAAYYDPTNYTYNIQYNQSVTNGALAPFAIFIPQNAVAFTVTVETNQFSPNPMPSLPVYIGFNDNPTSNTYDAMGSNSVTVTTPTLPVGNFIYYSVGDLTNGFVSFDVQTVVETTNDNGNYLTVLSNLNASLGPYYRYESGTSMSAAGVSGMLALMQEFFEQRLQLTNHSPALMKALLINGARTVSSQYDFQVGGALTSQGWGLPRLSNSIPGVLTNGGTTLPLQFFDQTTNMLATGQSKTRTLKMSTGTGMQPLRVTLVWTDPPGNPAAGVKLVNDLDLIVSNLDNPTNSVVFYGNDIPAGSDYNLARAATNAPTPDSVNNVENVYLFPPLGTNYSITVYGHRVNVNAVDSNTTNVVQDYALVVSYGDGGVFSNAFTLTDVPLVSSNGPSPLTTVSNGIPLLNQRVGGNSQFAYTNGNTNGVIGQWQFYIYTNTPSLTNHAYSNVAFVTFDPENLGVPRMGTRQEANPANGVRASADVDLYVSTDPNLTNLTPAVVNAAYQSLSRTGTQKVLLDFQPVGQVYYIGVKSEDQQGGQFGFLGVAITNSFGQFDQNGNVVLTPLTQLPVQIPGGSPAHPGSVTVLALTTANVQARKVVVVDTITHQDFGDLVGVLAYGSESVVLNNHSYFVNLGDPAETFQYDDSGEVGDPYLLPANSPELIPPAPFSGVPIYDKKSDGPGSLTSFVGNNISSGLWMFSMVNDSSTNDVGAIDNLTVFVEPQQANNGFTATIPADSWYYDFIDVPDDATNLTINVALSTLGPVDVYVRRGAFPDANDYDKSEVINAPGGTMTLSIFDSPPLNPGTYFIGVFNPTSSPQTVNVNWTFGLSFAAPQPLDVVSVGNEPIADDAVTYSTNHVGANSQVISAEVGVRINHPRESDLVLTLISPKGTRTLLAENRGGLDTNGYGSGTNITNFFGSINSGSNTPTVANFTMSTNAGTLIIPYNFFTVPDDMRVYYGATRIFDSGLINGAGSFSVDYGPGSATSVTIAMNEPGTNPNGTNGDAWTYQVTQITRAITYATFTEDTNKTTTPIKFAIPPFGHGPQYLPSSTLMTSSFEGPAGDYTNTTVDGWTVGTNPVKVVYVSALAANEGNALAGSNVLALHNGTIYRTLPTVAGQSYTLSFVNHGRPAAGPVNSPGPVGWWEGQFNANDASGNGNGGTFQGGAAYLPGLVGQAFSFNGTNQYVDIPENPTLDPTQSLTLETWFNPNVAGEPNDAPLMKKEGTNEINGYALEYDSSVGGLRFFIYNGTTPPLGWAGTPDTPVPPANTWTHVAGVFDNTNVSIYLNGVFYGNMAATGPIINSPLDLRIANTPDPTDSPQLRFFAGLIDEATEFSNALSILQIQDIYAAGSAGKCPVGGYVPVNANVILGGQTNVITGNDVWTTNVYNFTASSNGTVLEIQPQENGMLVDSFQLTSGPVLNPSNYYLPEEPLTVLAGEPSEGDWKLEVLDNRLGATNPQPNLVSWQLSVLLDRVNPAAISLTEGIPNTNCVPPNSVIYYVVNVPVWASFATNILTVNNGSLSLLFNQNFLPLTTNGDVTLFSGVTTSNSFVITTNGVPPLLPGQEYYLAVTNSSSTATACFTIEVDYDITTLTNMVPLTNLTIAATTEPRYFQYDVSTNALAVSFLLYNLSGNVNLVASKGFPLPDTNSYNYISANPGTNDETIIVSTNSKPVALTPGWWYLGVFNADTNPVTYTIEAVELTPLIIPLTNDERLTMTNVSPLASQETFFSFTITNSPTAALFELYNLSGNSDLTLDFNSIPFAPPFFMSSSNPGTNEEQIVIRTSQLGTNINGIWYLGVPNEASSNVTYTIHAVVATNGLLISAVPIEPVVTVPIGGPTGPSLTWATVNGECYDVFYSTNLSPVNWQLLPNMPVTATGTSTTVTDPTPITGTPFKFYEIVQTNCP